MSSLLVSLTPIVNPSMCDTHNQFFVDQGNVTCRLASQSYGGQCLQEVALPMSDGFLKFEIDPQSHIYLLLNPEAGIIFAVGVNDSSAVTLVTVTSFYFCLFFSFLFVIFVKSQLAVHSLQQKLEVFRSSGSNGKDL